MLWMCVYDALWLPLTCVLGLLCGLWCVCCDCYIHIDLCLCAYVAHLLDIASQGCDIQLVTSRSELAGGARCM